MSGNALPQTYSTMRYRDAKKAMDWLEKAFGFEKSFVAEGENGIVDHAQMKIGASTIMLGSVRPGDMFGFVQPDEAKGVTQSVYIAVDDVETYYERAKEAGADIVYDLTEQDYGSKDFSVRDPEGHLWHFGTYRPE